MFKIPLNFMLVHIMGVYLLSGEPSFGGRSQHCKYHNIMYIPWTPMKLMEIAGSTVQLPGSQRKDHHFIIRVNSPCFMGSIWFNQRFSIKQISWVQFVFFHQLHPHQQTIFFHGCSKHFSIPIPFQAAESSKAVPRLVHWSAEKCPALKWKSETWRGPHFVNED